MTFKKTMQVLVVVSGNSSSKSPFVLDQVRELEKNNIKVEYFLIKGKGLFGYLKNFNLLLKRIASYAPDLIHAHYGLSGLLSVLQRKVPVIITFHGSDINDSRERFLSNIANRLSSRSIFVSRHLARILNQKTPIVIPCGVDMDVFYPIDKKEARIKLGLNSNKKYVLFSSSFDNKVKNYPLAKESIEKIQSFEVELLELKGFSRSQVAILMNAVDVALLTSFTEGSPQFIKEAMATNTPIVSVDVGDVKDLIKNTNDCYLVKRDADSIAKHLEILLKNEKRTTGRKSIITLDNKNIAKLVINVYNSILG